MIEFLILFLAVYGTLLPYNDAARVGRLPGTENLGEKAIPLSRLSATETNKPPPPPSSSGNNNLAERAQIPGVSHVADNRIPSGFLKTLSQPFNE